MLVLMSSSPAVTPFGAVILVLISPDSQTRDYDCVSLRSSGDEMRALGSAGLYSISGPITPHCIARFGHGDAVGFTRTISCQS
jgi:hypothetical protein